MFWFKDSLGPRILSSLAHAKIEKTEMIKIATLQMDIIRFSIQLISKKLISVAIETIIRKTRFTNHTWIYP